MFNQNLTDSLGNEFRPREEQLAEFGNALSFMTSPDGIFRLLVLMDSDKKPLAQNGYSFAFIKPIFNLQACIGIARDKARRANAEWAILLDYDVSKLEFTGEIHIKANPSIAKHISKED